MITKGKKTTTQKKTTTKNAAKPKAAIKTKAKPATKKKTTQKRKIKPVEIQPITKSKAEELCQGVNSNIREQAVTLANAVLSMQEKIEQQIPTYKNEPLAQKVKVGTGETMLRQNPAVQEFRATVRDYAAALNNLRELLDVKKEDTAKSAVEDIKSRFKIG